MATDPKNPWVELSQVLHQAAAEVWRTADAAGADSPLHALGLGIFLVRAHTSALLSEHLVLAHEVDHRGVGELLHRAERLARAAVEADAVSAHALAARVADLADEARRCGY